jgi:hypothetical protein
LEDAAAGKGWGTHAKKIDVGRDVNVPNAITGASSSKTAGSPGTVSRTWAASGVGDCWNDVAVEVTVG